MEKSLTNLQTRLYAISAIILLVGLSSSLLIYLTAGNPTGSPLISDYQNSKRYIHDLELYGGKMNVLADQFRLWFDSLWQGKSLALTTACITIFLALGCSFVAYHLPNWFGPDSRDEGDN